MLRKCGEREKAIDAKLPVAEGKVKCRDLAAEQHPPLLAFRDINIEI
jgi:hypothetical protein